MWPGVSGLRGPIGVRERIDLVLYLHPDTNMVAVNGNQSEWGWSYDLLTAAAQWLPTGSNFAALALTRGRIGAQTP